VAVVRTHKTHSNRRISDVQCVMITYIIFYSAYIGKSEKSIVAVNVNQCACNQFEIHDFMALANCIEFNIMSVVWSSD
jgi:hypothetical protein